MIAHNPLSRQQFSINCKGTLLSLETPLVMGILNVTPDSFYDGGKFYSEDSLLPQVEKMLLEGAAIIDIGGYSSRPGATHISEKEELSRVIPAIEQIIKELPNTLISIDTFRAEVAQQAVQSGASLVNDISSGDDDLQMLQTVAKLGVPYIAMHKKGSPQTMQHNPTYQDVTVEVLDYFIKKVKQCTDAGIVDIILDPGFGFGKTIEHNYSLLKNLEAFKMLDCPMLVGVSRKGMIKNLLNISSEEALNGTTVLNTIALTKGAHILRVHDVKEAVEAVKLVSKTFS